MRNHFFEKGQELKVPHGNFSQALHRLDLKMYSLERVQEPSSQYVSFFYAACTHSNFIRYLSCWDETEEVQIKKKLQKKLSLSKKKALNLQAFLSRKKIEQFETNSTKHSEEKDNESKKQQFKEITVVYIQLEVFFPLEVPKQIKQIKMMMALFYALAMDVYEKQKFWPFMIPVKNNEGLIKFVKRGASREEELVRLFNLMMKGKQIEEWSSEMSSTCETQVINGQTNWLAQKIHADLVQIIRSPTSVIVKIGQGDKLENTVTIIGGQTIKIEKQQCELPMEQFIIGVSSREQIIMEHKIFDNIVLQCETSCLLFNYLKNYHVS